MPHSLNSRTCRPTPPVLGIPALRLFILIAILSTQALAAPPTSPGDRNVSVNIVYPAKAFVDAGGIVYDITKVPFNAKGDGQTDDTQAFVTMMNVIRDGLEKLRNKEADSMPSFFYVPNGTYLVSDTIVHDVQVNNGFAGLRLIGQDRTKTIIRLKDNSPGFEAGSKKPLLTWSKDPEHHQCGIAWCNEFRNITLDTGKGNPGAVGVLFLGANSCSMGNVTVRSQDGQGHAGIYFPTWAIQGYFHDITIEGFDYGVEAINKAETNPTFEYLTVTRQNKAGFHVVDGCPSIRMMKSENKVPAILVDGPSAHVVVVDSKFTGGDKTSAAIILNAQGAQIFARDIDTAGYGKGAEDKSGKTKPAPAGRIVEWLNGSILRMGNQTPARSMRLRVEEAPIDTWETDLAKWSTPEDFEGADAERIQKALNAGKPNVMLSGPRYVYKEILTVPKTVRFLDLMNQNARGTIEVNEPSDQPLWIDHPGQRLTIVMNAARPLIVRGGDASIQQMVPKPAVVHLMTVCNLGDTRRLCPPGAKVFARNVNNEIKSAPNFSVAGGQMWVLGFKTEGSPEAFAVTNNGVLEVLGGYRNQAGSKESDRPMLLNDGGNISFVGFSSMARIFPQAIWDTKANQKLTASDLPTRSAYRGNYFVPLYVNYTLKQPRTAPPPQQ